MINKQTKKDRNANRLFCLAGCSSDYFEPTQNNIGICRKKNAIWFSSSHQVNCITKIFCLLILRFLHHYFLTSSVKQNAPFESNLQNLCGISRNKYFPCSLKCLSWRCLLLTKVTRNGLWCDLREYLSHGALQVSNSLKRRHGLKL